MKIERKKSLNNLQLKKKTSNNIDRYAKSISVF